MEHFPLTKEQTIFAGIVFLALTAMIILFYLSNKRDEEIPDMGLRATKNNSTAEEAAAATAAKGEGPKADAVHGNAVH